MKFGKTSIMKALSTLTVLLLASLAMSCAGGNQGDSPAPPEYAGVGHHQKTGDSTAVAGEIKLKNPTGIPITVEARYSVPCAYGHCPVIGDPPLDQKTLNAPGPYQLTFEDSAQDVMVIAIYQPVPGQTRIAHQFLGSHDSSISGVDLSLDKPYPPLR